MEAREVQLPVSKIKRIMKFDPSVQLASQESAYMVTAACELFLRSLAVELARSVQQRNRKTCQIQDFDACVRGSSRFDFLDGAIDTWCDNSVPRGAGILTKRPASAGDADAVEPAADDEIINAEEAAEDVEMAPPENVEGGQEMEFIVDPQSGKENDRSPSSIPESEPSLIGNDVAATYQPMHSKLNGGFTPIKFAKVTNEDVESTSSEEEAETQSDGDEFISEKIDENASSPMIGAAAAAAEETDGAASI